MRVRLLLALVGGSLVLGGPLACKPADAPPVGINEPAPAFETKSIDGDDVSRDDYRGQVVLLNVWVTWCDPCVRELPELQRMHEQLHDKGLTVIGLNTDVRGKLGAVRQMVVHNDGFPGGHPLQGPRLGRSFVHWNVRITGGRLRGICEPASMPLGALVGVDGCGEAAGDAWVDAAPASPVNLHAAQRAVRWCREGRTPRLLP